MSNSIVYQGRGSSLKFGDGMSPEGFTKIAQLQKFSFGGMKATIEDVTNLDSPTAFKEKLPTVVDAGDVSFDGVLNPADTSNASLVSFLQAQSLKDWKITLKDGTTITFAGYVTEYVPANVDYSKAITFSGKIEITGAIVVTPAV